MKIRKLLIFLFTFYYVCDAQELSMDLYVENKFSPPNATMDHMAIYGNNLYIGAENRLYQVDKSLRLLQTVKTGPVLDNVNCQPFSGIKDSCIKVWTNNSNQLLLVDEQNNRLIVCGSVFQGTCKTRSLQDITKVYHDITNTSSANLKPADFVACNQKGCSTVGVITQGPTVNNNVLYVAATDSDYQLRPDYSIATHSLHHDPTKENKLFHLAIESLAKSSILTLRSVEATSRQYKFAFATGDADGFVYFVFYSPMNKISKTVVGRICKGDTVYFSYMELPISCGNGITGILLAANYIPDTSNVNSDGTLYLTVYQDNEKLPKSLLCSIRKSHLDEMFYQTLNVCYKHKGTLQNGVVIANSLDVSSTNECHAETDQKPLLRNTTSLKDDVVVVPLLKLTYYPDYFVPTKPILCGGSYLPSKITRLASTEAKILFEKSNANFSAITTCNITSVNGPTIAILGTTNGNIIQVNLNTGKEYASIKIKQAILSQFIWDPTPNLPIPRLYVQSKSEVLLMNVSACHRFTSCDTCITSHDPYCGWCILESRCSSQTQCKTAALDKVRWLGPNTDQCISINPPEPRERTLDGDISTTVYLLPVLDGGKTYKCLFDKGYQSTVNTRKIGSLTEIKCQAPIEAMLPQSLYKKDYVNVSLSIMYGDEVIVSTTAIFFDCHAHGVNLNINSPCSGCLSSKWGCRWYVEEHKCLAEQEPCGSQCITQQSLCPTLDSIKPEDQLIPVNEKRSITLYGRNLPDDGTYSCHIKIGNGNSTYLKATRNRNEVTCEAHKYSYSQDVFEANATIMIRWKLSFVMDYKENTPLKFYKCSVKHSDCSLCVSADQRYKCGWCETSQTCSIRNLCSSDWLTDGLQCPIQEIKSFNPMYGPLSGGTLVSISGTNMGTRATDIQAVTVAGKPCDVLNDRYKTSQRVVCQTRAMTQSSGIVAVTIRNVTQQSTQVFQYRNPVLYGVMPKRGPMAGGTQVNITGKNLKTGSDIRVSIGDLMMPCHYVKFTNTELVCMTSQSSRPQSNLTVFVQFDDLFLSIPNTFQYTQNPKVTKLFTSTAGELTSFIAGGRNISVYGTNLNSVVNPSLIAKTSKGITKWRTTRSTSQSSRFLHNLMKRQRRSVEEEVDRALSVFLSSEFRSFCFVKNSTFMICPTPEISTDNLVNSSVNISQNVQILAELSLEMDDHVITLKNLVNLTYFPNPFVEKLPDNYQIEGHYLKLKVYNLNEQAITKREIIVMIGSKKCQVYSIESEELLCEVPTESEGTKFPVTVRIGNMLWEVGHMTYPDFISGISVTTIVIIVVIICVAFLAGLGFFCYCQKKSNKANKNDFQKAMENMEMSVRADFRKAFAELSIDMSDLTSDVGDYGIPCLDYRTYITNLFFPRFRHHLCMSQPDPDAKIAPELEQGLSQFLLLLSNHNFLSIFIRTLEEQKNFSARDKGKVASLLSVVLHHKLDYFTEIMKSLVSDLIAVNVQRNPKLIMRRTALEVNCSSY